MTYILHQDRDNLVGLRETVIVDSEPYIVADIEPAPGTDWFLSRLNRNGQVELLPCRVVATLERFDGNPA